MRGGRLQEVGNFWYFGKLVTEKGWSLASAGRNWRFDCNWQIEENTLHKTGSSAVTDIALKREGKRKKPLQWSPSQIGTPPDMYRE